MTRDEDTMPIMVTSQTPGPLVWLVGGIHGDEPGGSAVVEGVLALIQKHGLTRGSVATLPRANPSALAAGTREIPETKEDLNRSFPGNKEGTIAQKLAHNIFTAITATKPTFVADIHTGEKESVPYLLIDEMPRHNEATKIYLSSNVPVVNDTSNSGVPSTLSGSCVAAGIPSFTFECGSSYEINERDVRVGIAALWNILLHLQMVTDIPEAHESFPYPQEALGHVLGYSEMPPATQTGTLVFLKPFGAFIQKDEPYAEIHDEHGTVLETLTANAQSIMLDPNFPTSKISAGQTTALFGVV